MEINRIYHGDARTLVQQLEDKSIQTIVTSPPYFGLRDYDVADQIGLEETPEEYIRTMVQLFTECRKKLRDDGTLWLNVGDSYARNGGEQSGGNRKLLQMDGRQKRMGKIVGELKPKDLIGIPWMLAFALRADGWYLRQDIIWHKPNPMPESVTDRCTKSHEYIFLLSKSMRYYFDQKAIAKPAIPHSENSTHFSDGSKKEALIRQTGAPKSWNGSTFEKGKTGEMMETHGHTRKSGNKQRKPGSDRGLPANGIGPDIVNGNVAGSVPWEGEKANKRSVWTVNLKPFRDAHFATFPEKLIVDCIKAGSPEGSLVLDPFMGAGTTALVARKLYRNFIGFELNKKYIKIAEKRLCDELGIFI